MNVRAMIKEMAGMTKITDSDFEKVCTNYDLISTINEGDASKIIAELLPEKEIDVNWATWYNQQMMRICNGKSAEIPEEGSKAYTELSAVADAIVSSSSGIDPDPLSLLPEDLIPAIMSASQKFPSASMKDMVDRAKDSQLDLYRMLSRMEELAMAREMAREKRKSQDKALDERMEWLKVPANEKKKTGESGQVPAAAKVAPKGSTRKRGGGRRRVSVKKSRNRRKTKHKKSRKRRYKKKRTSRRIKRSQKGGSDLAHEIARAHSRASTVEQGLAHAGTLGIFTGGVGALLGSVAAPSGALWGMAGAAAGGVTGVAAAGGIVLSLYIIFYALHGLYKIFSNLLNM